MFNLQIILQEEQTRIQTQKDGVIQIFTMLCMTYQVLAKQRHYHTTTTEHLDVALQK